MQTDIRINLRSFIYALLFIAGIWLVIEIRGILAILFAAFILMSGIKPSVDKMISWKLPRNLAILTIYIIFITTLFIIGTIFLPPLINETARLVNNFPNYLIQVGNYINIDQQAIIQQIGPLSQNALKVTLGLFSDILMFFTVAVFTFYLLLARDNLKNSLTSFISENQGQKLINLLEKVELRIGSWIRGQLLLGLIIGMASYVGLTILGISYALPLALIAGILEMVPTIGPIISAIPAMLIAVTISPSLALLVALLYFIIQQLENHLLVPQVMQKTTGIPPLISIIVLLIGGKLGGPAGVILSIPAYLVIETIAQSLLKKS